MNILLDTNIYLTNYILHETGVTALESYLSKSGGHLLTSKVIEGEIKRNIISKLDEEYVKISKMHLFSSNILDGIDIRTENVSETILQELTKKIQKCRTRELEYSGIDLSELIDRAVNKVAPFSSFEKEGDKGFKDTIIWLQLKNYLINNDDNFVAFISSNTKDFGDQNLSKHLKQELISSGVNPERLIYYNSIGDFLNDYSEKIEYINDAYIRDAIEGDIINSIDSIDTDSLELDSIIDRRDLDLGEVEYEGFDIERYYIYRATNKEYIVYVEVSAEFTVYFSYYDYDYSFNFMTGDYDYQWVVKNDQASAANTYEYFIYINKLTKKVSKIIQA